MSSLLYPSVKAVALQGITRSATVPALPDWLPAVPPEADSATTLLHHIAMVRMAHLAGHRSAPQAHFQMPAVPEETRPYCSPLAVKLWNDIVELESKYPIFEQKWLELCAQRQQVLAPDLIVGVFQFAAFKKSNAMRPLVRRIAGSRGAWIAAQYAPWSFALPNDPVQIWREGKPAERLDVLHDARRYDPALSRQLLTTTWEKETGSDRKKFVEICRTGLSAADEPMLLYFWETLQQPALLNKSIAQETRQMILALLLSLPESALYREWTTLLSAYFSTGKCLLPTTDDAFFHPNRMTRQAGLSANLPISAWFELLLGIVPPAVWQAATGKTTAQTLELLRTAKLNPPVTGVTERLIQATLASGDSAWAEVLLQAGTNQQFLELMALLPGELREKAIRDPKLSKSVQQLVWGSPAIQFNWSLDFSQWVLDDLYQSWIGYFFSKVQQIMPLDVFLHPDTRPDTIPGLYDGADKRERWMHGIVPELNKTLAVKKVLSKY